MIANARMYSVDPTSAALWQTLLVAVIQEAGVPITLVEHPAPAPLEELWQRPDLGAVFMCGLPFSRTLPQPALIAAPVPSPAEFSGEARYWSVWVVKRDSAHPSVRSTFGGRIAFTVPGSQSGYVAGLSCLMQIAQDDGGCQQPLFDEIVAPTVTPLGALSAVIRGDADIAPVDAYAFHLLQRYRPELTAQVRVVGQTAPTPIPALVGANQYRHPLQNAFLAAHTNAASRGTVEKLLLRGFAAPDAGSYDVLRERYEVASKFWAMRPLARLTHPAFRLSQ
jgi:ABC-type phosphate/phosphonate transport system substrate-binding protein